MVGVYLLGNVMPMHLDIKPTYLVGVLVGGLIFGIGFAVGGYCPGTCVVGIGERRRDAWFALFGGVIGALLFTVVYRLIEAPLIKPMNYGKITLADLLHWPPLVVAVAFAAILVAFVAWIPTMRARREPEREPAASAG
jgi:hypothetical protein